ncbi:MAG: hypothetical protein ACFFCW_30240 [Candidatus Hodarchaeota archaeon]
MRKFYENARKLDQLKALAEPSQLELEQLLNIIKEDEALAFYFYEENKFGSRPTSGWFKLLADAGEFEVLQGAEASNKPVPRLKARYLAESAKVVPEEVLKVTGSIKTKDKWTQGVFLEAIRNMPDDYIEKGDWIFWEFFRSPRAEVWFYAGDSAAKLMIKMIEINPDKAFGMAKVLLELRVSGNEDNYSEKPTSHFEIYHYEELIKAYCKEVCARYPIRAAKVILSVLSDYLESVNREESTERQDFLYYPVRDLAVKERFGRYFLATLIEGICEAGKIAIQKEPENLDELFMTIRDRNEGIFKRIEMYLLCFVDDQAYTERINEIISNRKNFDNAYVEFEYIRLLKQKFNCLTENTKNVYIDWIKGIHVEDKEEYNQWFIKVNGKACTDADVEKYENGMRARKLYDVREVFPELYKELSEKSGWSEEDIKPWKDGEIRSIDPAENSPKTKDELLEMSVQEVLSFVSNPENYKETGKEWKPSTPKEGLVYEFQKTVKEKPLDYLNASLDAVLNLDEDFLSRYFHGIWDAIRDRKVERFDWDKYLEKAKAIVDKFASGVEIHRAFQPLIDSLRECFKDNNKIEYTFERLEAIYDIVRPLLELKEEKDTTYDKDPMQLRCNSVTGEALDRCVSLGIVCRKDFEKQWQDSFRDKIRNAFEKVLNEIKTPWTYCTFGSDLSRIYWFDREWVEAKIGIILSNEMWDIVWNTYLKWGRPSRDLFVFLAGQGIYSKAISKLEKVDEVESEEKIEEKLSDHLVIAYFNGWLENDLGHVYEEFLTKATDSLLGHTSEFFTTGFKYLNEQPDEENKKEVIVRLKEYWEQRLNNISSEPEKHIEEAKGLTSWIIDSPFETKDVLQLFSRTLTITKGKIERKDDIGHSINNLCKFAVEDSLTALKCIRKLLINEYLEVYDKYYKDGLERLLNGIIREEKPNINVLQEAINLVDDFGRLHIYDYANFYDLLNEKLQKLQKVN